MLWLMVEALRDVIAAIAGVVESPSMFKDDLGYWVHGKEIVHFEDEDLIEIRLTRDVIRERREELRGDPRVTLRYSGADWVTVRFSEPEDVTLVVGLIEDAADAHRAPSGVTPDPPPTGSELERRRRFH